MSTRATVVAFLTTLIVFVALDAAWLTLCAFDMFKREIGSILRAQPYLGAVGVLYLIYATALTALAVMPAVERGHVAGAAWRGALLGLCAYATYDLTNYATLNGYSMTLAFKDMAWGTAASTAASVAGFWIATRLR